MNWKLVSVLIMLVFIYSAVGFAYTIDGDTVYINDSRAYISATPHTIASSGWVYINLTSKTFTGDIDVAFGFDTDLARPTRAELYSPHTYYWNDTYVMFVPNVTSNIAGSGSCDYGNDYNTFKRNVTWDLVDNVTTEQKNNIFCFDSYENVTNDYTITWHTEESEARDWKDYTSAFTSLDYDHGGMNKWWYVQNVPVVANQSYLMRGYVEIPVIFGEGTSTKYWLAVKRSADTMSEAISNDRFYSLDPWYNSSWKNRKQFNFTDAYSLSRNDEIIRYNLSADSDISSTYNYDDVRVMFDDGSSSREIKYELMDENVLFYTDTYHGNSANKWIVFTADLTLSGDYYIYYNNSGATAPSYSGIVESSGTGFASDCLYKVDNQKMSYWVCRGASASARNGLRQVYLNSDSFDFGHDLYAYNNIQDIGGTYFYDDVFTMTKIYEGDVVRIYTMTSTSSHPSAGGTTTARATFHFYYNTTRWDWWVGATDWDCSDYVSNNFYAGYLQDYFQTSANATVRPTTESGQYNLSYFVTINSTELTIHAFTFSQWFGNHTFNPSATYHSSAGLNYDWDCPYGNNQTYYNAYDVSLDDVDNLTLAKKIYYPVDVSVGAEETYSPEAPSVQLIFDFAVIDFSSVIHNTTTNSAVNNYTITVNATGGCTPRITFEYVNPPLTYSTFNISSDNIFFNYTIETTPYPTLLSLDLNRTINVTDTDNVYPDYYLDVPYLQRAGAYTGNHTITGWCA